MTKSLAHTTGDLYSTFILRKGALVAAAIFLLVGGLTFIPTIIFRSSTVILWQQQQQNSRYHSKHRGPQDLYCGSGWQERYRHLHAAALANKKSPRILHVSTNIGFVGLGNSLDGILSMFYVALLMERAIVIDEKLGLPFTSIFDSPYGLNYTADHDYVDSFKFSAADLQFGTKYLHLPFIDKPDKKGFTVIDTMTSGNLTALWQRAPVVKVASAAPYYDQIFNNPYHKKQLFRYGLSPETAHGCALRYLFTPNAHMLERFKAQFEYMNDPDILVIGIHARFGDEATFEAKEGLDISNQTTGIDYIFKCAQDIETAYGPGAKKGTLWFLMSDSEPFRQVALQKYRDKVVSYTETKAAHVAMEVLRDRTQHAETDAEYRQRIREFELAAGEYWLYSLADFHIKVGKHSTFNTGAAAASQLWASTVDLGEGDSLKGESCLGGLHRAHESWGV